MSHFFHHGVIQPAVHVVQLKPCQILLPLGGQACPVKPWSAKRAGFFLFLFKELQLLK